MRRKGVSKRPTHQPTMINSCAMQPTFHALLVIPYNSFYFSTYILCKTNQAQFTTYLSSSNAIESDVFKKKNLQRQIMSKDIIAFCRGKWMAFTVTNHHCAACTHFFDRLARPRRVNKPHSLGSMQFSYFLVCMYNTIHSKGPHKHSETNASSKHINAPRTVCATSKGLIARNFIHMGSIAMYVLYIPDWILPR